MTLRWWLGDTFMGDIWPSWASPGEAAGRFAVRLGLGAEPLSRSEGPWEVPRATVLLTAVQEGSGERVVHSAAARLGQVGSTAVQSRGWPLPHSCFSAGPASIACAVARLRCPDGPIDGNLYGPIAVSRAVFSHRFLRLQFVSRYSHVRSRWTRKSLSTKGILVSLSSGEHHCDGHLEPRRHRWVAVYGVGLSAKAHVCLHL